MTLNEYINKLVDFKLQNQLTGEETIVIDDFFTYEEYLGNIYYVKKEETVKRRGAGFTYYEHLLDKDLIVIYEQ